MSRKKEQTPSLREKIRTYQRELHGEASRRFTEVICAQTETSSFKEALTVKNIHKAFVMAKLAIADLIDVDTKLSEEENE